MGGAGAGAAIGSAFAPGIGTAIGAGVGAVGGGVVGARKGLVEKREWKKLKRADTAGPRKLVLAEFITCMAIAGAAPLAQKDQDATPGRLMKQLAAIMVLFFLLGLLTSAGRGAAKVAAAFGGVVTLTLVVSQRDLLVTIAQIFNRNVSAQPTSQGPANTGTVTV